ncbi:MAG: O-antigen ligase family protein [Bacteroidia bacterium]|nr:O-antigen ligase family protein [Bacteroidia bacterium]
MPDTATIQRPVYLVVLLALLTGAVAFWASLHDFYFVFLIPVAIAIFLMALLRTEKLLLLTGAIAPLSVNINDIGGGLGLALPTEPLINVLFGLIGFSFLQKGTRDTAIFRHPLSVAILLYLAWLWLSSFFSSMPLVSIKFVLARTWYIALFYFAATVIFSRYDRIHFFLRAFAIFTLALVIFTLTKHAADGFVRSSSYSISWPFFPDHGMYAAAIAFAVPILAFYTFHGQVFRIPLVWAPVVAFFLVVLLFGVVVSYTRATWLSLVVALGVYVLLRFRVKFIWILLALVSVSTYGIVKQDQILYSLEANKQGSSDELEGHVKSVSNITTDPSNMERINRWKCASRMAAMHPFFGFGPGTFVFQYGVFQKSSEKTIISTNAGDLGDAHSEFFSAMAEAGFPGLMAWFAVVLISVAVSFRLIYTTPDRKVRITAMIALLGLITYYAHALLNNYSQYDKVAVPLWAFMAIITALDMAEKRKRTAPE